MAYANFKPLVWSELIDRELKKNLVYGMLANRSYEGDIAQEGDSVKIASISAVTVGDYNGSDINFSEDEGATQTILINKAKYFGLKMDDVDKAQAKGGIMDLRVQNAIYKMADAVDQDLADLYKKAKIKVTATLGTDRVSAKIIDLAVKMDEANVPTAGRWLVVSPEVYGELLKELPGQFSGDNSFGVNQNYYLGKWGGFEIFRSNNVPFATKKYHCMAGISAGITLAMQLSKIEAGTFEKSFAEFVKGLNVYGCDVLETEAGKTSLISEFEVTQATV